MHLRTSAEEKMSKRMPKLLYGQDMHRCWSEGNKIAEKIASWWVHRTIERRLAALEGCVGKLEITVGEIKTRAGNLSSMNSRTEKTSFRRAVRMMPKVTGKTSKLSSQDRECILRGW